MFPRHWLRGIRTWWSPARPRARRREFPTQPAMIGRMECLEPRRMLANVVTVEATSQGVSLIDVGSRQDTAGDAIDITYTASQITLTARNGTQLNVNGTNTTTHTIDTAKATPLFIALNAPGNTVTITGDGQASLAWLEVRFGNDQATNSLTLDKVHADSVTVVGRRSNTNVTAQQSTINGALRALLGKQPTGSLTVDQSTINGPVRAETQQLTANQTTFDGRVSVFQTGADSTLTTTASTFNDTLAVRQGSSGVVNVNASTNGPNRFHGPQIIKGDAGHNSTLNVADNAAINDIPPTLIRVDSKTATPPTAPTVESISATTAPAAVTGTWDSVNAKTLKVTVGSTTYTLGTDAKLTSPSAGKWSLDLTGTTIPAGETKVTAVNENAQGNNTQGTGTITVTPVSSQQQSINTFLTANQLTATKTASGLNYVVVSQGTGPVPTNGQSITANYSGYLLNANGTQGTKFDSNEDPAFGHVSPFRFTLGQGRVIAGWDEAFALLPVGSVAKLLIPSALGYGAGGSSNIPPDSILIFDVTLLSAQ